MLKSFNLLFALLILASCSTNYSGEAPKELYDVNTQVNETIEYTPDYVDFWQTPQETLLRGKGDCEDYAILKSAMLGGQGSIIATRIKGTEQWHAVLKVTTGYASSWYLDNRFDKPISKQEFENYYSPPYVDCSRNPAWCKGAARFAHNG